MSIYTMFYLITAFIVIASHIKAPRRGVRDRDGALVLMLAFLPFIMVPGLSDDQYVQIPANSEIVGGALAAVVAYGIFRISHKVWHVMVGLLLVGMVFWNSASAAGLLGEYTHAIGLEVIFYLIMIGCGLTHFFIRADQFPRIESFFDRMLGATWRDHG